MATGVAGAPRSRAAGLLAALALATAIASAAPGQGGGAEPSFLRGDVDASGGINILDALLILRWFYILDPATLPCEAAADVNGDGQISGALDAFYLLEAMFEPGSPLPPPPYPVCAPAPAILPCDEGC